MSDTTAGPALYLIPTLLGLAPVEDSLAAGVLAKLRQLDAFVVENAKSARQFLKLAGHPAPLASLAIEELNEHTPADRVDALGAPLLAGRSLGLLSEAGCPAVADPGGALVEFAHRHGVRVEPLVGPSSLMLALMASGLQGQRFCFHGYLPVEPVARDAALQELERQSARERATQLFIETPYRNDKLLAAVMTVCKPTTRLCVAVDLTLPRQWIWSGPIQAWRTRPAPELSRRPAVFLMLA